MSAPGDRTEVEDADDADESMEELNLNNVSINSRFSSKKSPSKTVAVNSQTRYDFASQQQPSTSTAKLNRINYNSTVSPNNTDNLKQSAHDNPVTGQPNTISNTKR